MRIAIYYLFRITGADVQLYFATCVQPLRSSLSAPSNSLHTTLAVTSRVSARAAMGTVAAWGTHEGTLLTA